MYVTVEVQWQPNKEEKGLYDLPVKGFPHQNVEPLELCLTE